MKRQIKEKVRFFNILLHNGFIDVTQKIHTEYEFTEQELTDYTLMMKRAFAKGSYCVNCDYSEAWIKVGERTSKIEFTNISDKLIALIVYLASLKSENCRYKFGRYICNVGDVYDAVMKTYPYSKPSKNCKVAIENARNELPKILEKVMSFK